MDIGKGFTNIGSTVLFLFALSTQAWAVGYEPWTAAGSTGTVDDNDTSEVYQSAGYAGLKSPLPAGASAYIRYNVTATDGLINRLDGYRLGARYRDNGDGRVLVRLVEYNSFTGAGFTRMTLDSNSFPVSAGFQYRTTATCWPAWSFDFSRNVYYVEVFLYKGTTAAMADIGQLRVEPTLC